MKNEKRQLLNDVMGETASSDFRANVLSQTLQTVRHRKRVKRLTRVGVSFSVLILVAITFFTIQKKDHPDLASDRLVKMIPVKEPPFKLVVSTAESARIVRTEPALVQVVSTVSQTNPVPYLSDEMLLSFFPNRPVALIAESGKKRLAILDEQDSALLPQ